MLRLNKTGYNDEVLVAIEAMMVAYIRNLFTLTQLIPYCTGTLMEMWVSEWESAHGNTTFGQQVGFPTQYRWLVAKSEGDRGNGDNPGIWS